MYSGIGIIFLRPSPVNISSLYKKLKLFKQLSLTPLSKGEWLVSKVLWCIFLGVISFVLMVGVGTFGFGAHVYLSVWLIPFLILGPMFFVSFNDIMAYYMRTERHTTSCTNINWDSHLRYVLCFGLRRHSSFLLTLGPQLHLHIFRTVPSSQSKGHMSLQIVSGGLSDAKYILQEEFLSWCFNR